MREFYNSTKTVNAVSPKTSTGNETLTGHIIDRAGFESVLFEIAIGAKTDGTITPAVVEGDVSDLSDGANVAAGDLIGSLALATVGDAAAGADSARKIGYKGTKRYVRLDLVIASNAGSCPVGATALLGHARHAPAQTGDGAAVTQVP